MRPRQPDPVRARRGPDPALLLLALALVLLRGPLWALPGLGRDEAMYVLWAHHPLPAYAPLLQLLLAGVGALGVDAAWCWRMPSISSGVLVLLLFDRWMGVSGAPRAARRLALALFALSPWQTYAGAILHPDDLQLAAVFGFAWAARSGRRGWALVAAALAPWAKPSGLLVTAIALLWSAKQPGSRARRLGAGGLTLLVAVTPLAFAHAGLFSTLLSFGRIEPGASVIERFALLLLGVAFLAGPGAWTGLVRGLLRVPRPNVADAPDRALGLAFLVAFATATLVSGQAKGNWLLPGLFLLWPMDLVPATRLRARLGWSTAIAASLLLAASLSLAFARPDLARAAERRWGSALLPSYLRVAGQREAEVAAARRWWHRPAEYRSLATWCEAAWPSAPVTVVVSDDYGLAAQWAVQCPTTVPRLVLPRDGLLPRPALLPAGTLVIAARGTVAELVGTEGWQRLGALPHPITGAPVQRALVLQEIDTSSGAHSSKGNSP